MVLAFPAFAAGLPPAITEFSRLVAMSTQMRLRKFTTEPHVRNETITKQRKTERESWWSAETKRKYNEADPTSPPDVPDEYLLASVIPMPLSAGWMVPASWGSGSNAGYPIPGEGSVSAGGSGRTSPQGILGVLNTATGNTTFKLPVLSFPVEGDLGVNLDLFQNSQSSHDFEVGSQWSHSYDSMLILGEDFIFVEMPDGLVVPYDRNSGSPHTPPPGWFATLTYVNSTTYKLTFKDQHEYIYTQSAGLLSYYLSAVKDRHGNTITVNRNGSNKVTSVVAPDNRTVSFTYTSGRVTSIGGPNSKTWSLSYTSGKLTGITYPALPSSTPSRAFGYDANKNLTSETDAEGNEWTWTYNSGNDSLATYKDPAVATATAISYFTGYVEIDQPWATGDWTHTYSSGLLYSIEDPDGFFQYFTNYNSNFLPQEVEDQNANVSLYTYDAMGNVETAEDALANVWEWDYNGTNDVTESRTPLLTTGTPALQQKTIRSWSGGVLQYSTDELGFTTNFTYDTTTKDLIEIEDPEQLVTTIHYNANGDVDWTEDPAGIQIDFTYDDYGRKLTKSDSVPNTTTSVYDAWGRLIQLIYPDSSDIFYSYNKNSQLLTTTNENAEVWTNTYDTSGRLTTKSTHWATPRRMLICRIGSCLPLKMGGAKHVLTTTPNVGICTPCTCLPAMKRIRATMATGIGPVSWRTILFRSATNTTNEICWRKSTTSPGPTRSLFTTSRGAARR